MNNNNNNNNNNDNYYGSDKPSRLAQCHIISLLSLLPVLLPCAPLPLPSSPPLKTSLNSSCSLEAFGILSYWTKLYIFPFGLLKIHLKGHWWFLFFSSFSCFRSPTLASDCSIFKGFVLFIYLKFSASSQNPVTVWTLIFCTSVFLTWTSSMGWPSVYSFCSRSPGWLRRADKCHFNWDTVITWVLFLTFKSYTFVISSNAFIPRVPHAIISVLIYHSSLDLPPYYI